jgi:predicted HTH domain antitoxin
MFKCINTIICYYMSALSLPRTIENEINALVKGGYFRSKDSFIEESVKYMLVSRGDLKINAAVEMYRSGDVSLARAAEVAGMSIFEFKEVLKTRGITMVVEAPSKEEINSQIKRMEDAR